MASFPYNTIMSFPRFFCPEPLSAALSANLPFRLPDNAARHASRVLRLRVGDGLVLFDGVGGEYVARIATLEKDRVAVDAGHRGIDVVARWQGGGGCGWLRGEVGVGVHAAVWLMRQRWAESKSRVGPTCSNG